MSLKAISTALSTHLSQMPNLPPVAWENASRFKPSNGQLFLSEATLSAGVNGEDVAATGSTSFTGLYQVTVFAPVGGNKFTGMDMADQIKDHFSRGIRLQKDSVTVEIIQRRDNPAMQDSDWYRIPVTISYNAIV